MARFLWLLLALPILAFTLPVSPSADLRNATGFKLMQAKKPSLAKPIYAIGKIYGEPLSANNWHVLEYRNTMTLEGLSKAERRENREQARADFDAVGDKGLAAGYYNAAMICFKCGYKTPGHKKAVERLNRAIALGDELSEDALALMSKTNKNISEGERFHKLSLAADRGNHVAARYLAKKLYSEKTPEYEKYVLIAANAGNADAQAMAADIRGQDKIPWLQKAASAPLNRNIEAGVDLARLYEDAGRYQEARKWWSITGKPREKFNTILDMREDGLRWRGQRTTRVGDHGNTYIAATAAAGMKMAGLGGKRDRKAAQVDLNYVLKYQYGSAGKIMSIINSYNGEFIPEKVMIRANMQALGADFSRRNRDAVKPLLKTGVAQYFTPYHYYTWLKENTEAGLPTSIHAERNLKKLVQHCRTQKCFLLTRYTTLPKGMSGGNAVTFIIPEDVPAPSSPGDHNTYIYLGQNQSKRVRRVR